jgi:hypothetical protein
MFATNNEREMDFKEAVLAGFSVQSGSNQLTIASSNKMPEYLILREMKGCRHAEFRPSFISLHIDLSCL